MFSRVISDTEYAQVKCDTHNTLGGYTPRDVSPALDLQTEFRGKLRQNNNDQLWILLPDLEDLVPGFCETLFSSCRVSNAGSSMARHTRLVYWRGRGREKCTGSPDGCQISSRSAVPYIYYHILIPRCPATRNQHGQGQNGLELTESLTGFSYLPGKIFHDIELHSRDKTDNCPIHQFLRLVKLFARNIPSTVIRLLLTHAST
jgi:hypothetical protein